MQTMSPFLLWFRTPRLRRALALGAVVLSTGSIVLLRSSAAALPTAYAPTLGDTATRTNFSGPKLTGSLALSHGKVLERGGQMYADLTLTKKINTVDEVAALALLLVSSAGAGITGTSINVDAGTSPF